MSTSVVKYSLLNSLDYKFNICKINENIYDDLAYYFKENFPDLEIKRQNTDLSMIDRKYLITVNGYVYNTVYSNNKLYVPKATLSMLKSKSNSLGILNFSFLSSSLNKIPITTSNLSIDEGVSSFNRITLNFNEEIYYPILILAGYMIFENSVNFYRVSPNAFVLRLDKLDYVEKLYELYRYRNIFKELDVPVSNNNPYMVDGNLIRSDGVIKKFLTLHNSFLINMPVNNLRIRKIYLERTNVPGNFRTEIEPNLPLIAGCGKICEYMKKKNNDTKFTVYTNDAYYNNYLFSSVPVERLNVYNDHRVVTETYRFSPAYFLEISIDH